MPRLTFIGKADCHLCDDARGVVAAVLADFPGVELTERSILNEPELFEVYADEIPVVLIDDRVHTVWRVDAARLRSALAAAVDAEAIDSSPPPS